MTSVIKEVELPQISWNSVSGTVSQGSHYGFSHVYQIEGKDNEPIYKHIILTQDLSKVNSNEPVRKFIKNVKLYNLNKLVDENSFSSPALKECLSVIFDKELLFTKCSQDNLIDIKKLIIQKGYNGLISVSGDILIYTEKDIVSYEDYQIKYRNNITEDFLSNFINGNL